MTELVGAGNQLSWMDTELAGADEGRASEPWSLAHFHRPLYCSNNHQAQEFAHILRAEAEDIFVSRHVDLVINGHVHDCKSVDLESHLDTASIRLADSLVWVQKGFLRPKPPPSLCLSFSLLLFSMFTVLLNVSLFLIRSFRLPSLPHVYQMSEHPRSKTDRQRSLTTSHRQRLCTSSRVAQEIARATRDSQRTCRRGLPATPATLALAF